MFHRLMSTVSIAQTSSCQLLHMTNGNSVALPGHFCFGLQQERLCKTDLSGLKLSVNTASPCSKLLCTEVREAFRKQTLYD